MSETISHPWRREAHPWKSHNRRITYIRLCTDSPAISVCMQIPYNGRAKRVRGDAKRIRGNPGTSRAAKRSEAKRNGIPNGFPHGFPIPSPIPPRIPSPPFPPPTPHPPSPSPPPRFLIMDSPRSMPRSQGVSVPMSDTDLDPMDTRSASTKSKHQDVLPRLHTCTPLRPMDNCARDSATISIFPIVLPVQQIHTTCDSPNTPS
jgi:hypothetical protein